MNAILIAAHDPSLHGTLTSFFQAQGYDVTAVHSGADAIEKLTQYPFDLIITELRLPEKNGLDVLHASQNIDASTPVLLIAGATEVSMGTEALTLGAQDYLLKQTPFNLQEMQWRAERALERRRLVQSIHYLKRVQPHICDCEEMIGQSTQLQKILSRLKREILNNAPVLITGEPGTGKALLAAAIHTHSSRRNQTFVTVNCAALPERLLESELFGHEKGAFPGAHKRQIGCFEQAHQGTLFIHHIADMNPRMQRKVVRAIQDRKFERLGSSRTIAIDVRVVAATRGNSTKGLRERYFRTDLYSRLHAINVKMPPLREYPDDILPLAAFFLRRYNHRFARRVKGFDRTAQRGLVNYPWPGNLRELESAVAHGVWQEDGEIMQLRSLGLRPSHSSAGAEEERIVNLPPHGVSLKEIEKAALLQALRRTNWVQKDAAAQLDITPRVMHYKLKTHGIIHPNWGKRR